MKVYLNGEEREFPEVQTLHDLLVALEIDPGSSGFAIALNDVVVPKPELRQTDVHDSDRIELVHAVQGG